MIGEQLAWDAVAALASLVAGAFTVTRRHMLSGALARWHTAPGLVQAALAAQAIFQGYVAVSIVLGGDHATQRETMAYVLSAAVSVVMVANLDRTGRRDLPPGRTSP